MRSTKIYPLGKKIERERGYINQDNCSEIFINDEILNNQVQKIE